MIKTRLQSHKLNLQGLRTGNDSLLMRGVSIVKRGGVRSLWRGVGPHLATVIPTRGTYLAIYRGLGGGAPDSSPLQNAVAGVAGASVVVTLANPPYCVVTALRLAPVVPGAPPPTPLSVARDLWRQGGLRPFGRGLSASYWGLSETAIQMPLYEWLRAQASQRDIPGGAFGAGLVSKFVASLATYPHEVVRTRMRDEPAIYRRFWPSIAHIHRIDGWSRGLYGGLGAHLLRVSPNAAIMLGVYELVSTFMGDNDDNEEEE